MFRIPLALLVSGLFLFGSSVYRLARGVETIHREWGVADVGFGTKPSFDFDTQDRVHVMTMTESFDGGVWHGVASNGEGPWDLRQVSAGYFYGPGELRVDAGGTAHLAWHNHSQQDPNHLTVAPDGTTMLYPIVSPGHNGWDNSLALDGTGTLHQTSVYPSGFGATTSLEYGTFDGSSWQYDVVPGSGSFMYGFNTSVGIDSENRPHVAYTLAEDWFDPGDLNYAFQDDLGWHVSTVSDNGIRGRFPSLVVDAMDRPHIAWLDIDPGDTSRGWVQYGVLDSGVWSIEMVDTLEHVRLGFSGGRKQVSLALDQDGLPHIAYGDRQMVKYGTRSDGSWRISTVVESTDDLYNGLVVLRLDSHEEPGIVFWQDHVGQTGLVRFLAPLRVTPGDMDCWKTSRHSKIN